MFWVAVLNMPTLFHLEITWNSGLKPLRIFGQLCQKLKTNETPSVSSSFAHNGEKIIDHKIDHYLSLTFNNKIVEFFNCMKNALL